VLHEFSPWITHRPKVGYRLEVPKSEDLVRRGWHFCNRRTREGFEKALASFEEAALEDGTDFRAYEGLAASYLMIGTYSLRAPRDLYTPFEDVQPCIGAGRYDTGTACLSRAGSTRV